jgi:hypothetical protein
LAGISGNGLLEPQPNAINTANKLSPLSGQASICIPSLLNELPRFELGCICVHPLFFPDAESKKMDLKTQGEVVAEAVFLIVIYCQGVM